MDASRFTFSGNSIPFVAVSIQRGMEPQCNLHAGIVFRYRERLRRLHFAWHKDLATGDYRDGLACGVIDLDDADAIWLAKYFQRIAEHPGNREIPYNLKHDEHVAFNEETGAIAFGVDSTGLGCATFVVAAFRSGGHLLVDVNDWPPATDADRLRRLGFIQALNSGDADQQKQALRIEGEVDSPCIAPQHVFGACLEDMDARPANHAVCDANGQAAIALLDAGPTPTQTAATN